MSADILEHVQFVFLCFFVFFVAIYCLPQGFTNMNYSPSGRVGLSGPERANEVGRALEL
jgi:hypothetical protein